MNYQCAIFALAATLLGGLNGCNSQSPETDSQDLAATVEQVAIPEELRAGEAAFDANCAVCHGIQGSGTDQGPPLVHIIYEPSHHADIAFYMAVDRGVRAHHWGFGDMPPQPNLAREDVAEIVDYIRFLQRQAGIQ